MLDKPQPTQAQWRMPRQPVFYAALAYGVGTLVGAYCWRPMLWWVMAAGAGALASVFFAARGQDVRATAAGTAEHRTAGVVVSGCKLPYVTFANVAHRLGLGTVLLSFVALGALGIRVRNAADVRPDMSAVTDGREVVVTGYVVKDGAFRGEGAQRRESVDVEIESVEVDAREVTFEEEAESPASVVSKTVPEDPPFAARRMGHPTGPGLDKTDERRRRAACKANSVWSEELLRAAGIPVCAEDVAKDASRRRTGRPPLQPPSRRRYSPKAAIRLSIYSRERWDESDDGEEGAVPKVFTYGQRLRFVAKLRPPRNFGNPGALDYEGYLAQQGIYALGSARMDRVEVLEGGGGTNWGIWRSRIRRSIVAKIHTLWPTDRAALLDAMLIGEAGFIGRETKTDFQRTGIYHILVVSGMNVAILAAVIFWTLKRLRCSEIFAVVLTFILSCGYAYVAESGAPILRPVIMLSIFMFARILYREGAMLNALGIAALALMVYEPGSVTDPSFQLTFMSVLAIAGVAVPLMERTSGPYKKALGQLALVAKDPSLMPKQAQFRIELRMVAERLARFLPSRPKEFRGVPNKVLRERVMQRGVTAVVGAAISGYELLVVSLIAQITLTLPMAWYFHRVTVMSLPANLIAVPLVGILMPASVTAVALGYVWKPLAYLPTAVTSGALGGIMKAVQMFGGLRTADMRVATPPMMQALAAASAFALALVLVRRRWAAVAAGLVAVVVTALWIAMPGDGTGHSPVPTPTLELTSIDVGQAESALVVTPEGKRVLVDAGGSLGPWQSDFDFGEDVVSPYLWARGVTRLDAVCVTHAHSDHMGGMRAVIQNFRPRELWLGPTPDVAEVRSLLKQAKDAGMTVIRHAAGDEFEFGGAAVSVWSPPRSWVPGPKFRNNDSLVLRFSYGETSAMLEADAEKQMEEAMKAIVPHSDVIKIAHNGSKTSSTPEFLATVRPKYAVISVGARNSFGHPRREVLERLAEMHVSTYRTDMFGAVTFYLDGRQVTPAIRPRQLR